MTEEEKALDAAARLGSSTLEVGDAAVIIDDSVRPGRPALPVRNGWIGEVMFIDQDGMVHVRFAHLPRPIVLSPHRLRFSPLPW